MKPNLGKNLFRDEIFMLKSTIFMYILSSVYKVFNLMIFKKCQQIILFFFCPILHATKDFLCLLNSTKGLQDLARYLNQINHTLKRSTSNSPRLQGVISYVISIYI